jgi:hypothetical protein
MCCGQKRSELPNTQTQRAARYVPQYRSGNGPAQAVSTQHSTPSASADPQARSGEAPTPVSAPQFSIGVRYVETLPIRVRGLVSGVSYEFSGAAPVQQVDARDAPPLLNTRFFRRGS